MLNVDKLFVAALKADSDLMTTIGGRLFDPARTEEQDAEDKIPYLIVGYEGGSSTMSDKDVQIMNTLDGATVSVLCVAADRGALADLTEDVESAIGAAVDSEAFWAAHTDWPFGVDSIMESAGQVMLDQTKPCCYQTLTYQCSTYEK